MRVSIHLTDRTEAESQARVDATENLIRRMMGEQNKKARVPLGKGEFRLDYSADRWSPDLPTKDLSTIIVSLKGMWEEKIEFAESAEVAAAWAQVQTGEVSRVRLPSGRSFMSQGRTETLTSGKFGTFYDGNLAGANLNFTPVEAFPYKKPGLATDAPGIVFSTLAKDKTAEPPPLNGGHPYDAIIAEEAAVAGMDPAVLRAVIEAKGGFDAKANRKSGGSHGVMLITKAAAAAVGMKGADLNDARANIRVGARLMTELLQQFKGDVHRALAAYQVGAGAVIRSGGIPNDPEVKYFLAAYERALRGTNPKPEVKPVTPPSSPNARRVREGAGEKIREKVAEILPPSGIVRPRDPVSRYRKTIHLKAKKHEVDPWLIESIMRAENPWGDPLRESDAGAVGLMQLMPETAKMLRVNPRDPVQNIDGGTRHMKWLLERYNGNRVLAAAAYNAGEGVVGERIPNYPETKGYVAKVFAYYEDLTGEKVDHLPFMPIAKAKTNRRVLAARKK
ncbi:MAG: transglycosylase SLT domain-containing protein [Elusimicrobia bacterium]|nr:transglycosylase SLT domain-containing protein [Elusimicrobiota bacterium]